MRLLAPEARYPVSARRVMGTACLMMLVAQLVGASDDVRLPVFNWLLRPPTQALQEPRRLDYLRLVGDEQDNVEKHFNRRVHGRDIDRCEVLRQASEAAGMAVFFL